MSFKEFYDDQTTAELIKLKEAMEYTLLNSEEVSTKEVSLLIMLDVAIRQRNKHEEIARLTEILDLECKYKDEENE
jgi:hypothetical protein